jgi:hypothetical protein
MRQPRRALPRRARRVSHAVSAGPSRAAGLRRLGRQAKPARARELRLDRGPLYATPPCNKPFRANFSPNTTNTWLCTMLGMTSNVKGGEHYSVRTPCSNKSIVGIPNNPQSPRGCCRRRPFRRTRTDRLVRRTARGRCLGRLALRPCNSAHVWDDVLLDRVYGRHRKRLWLRLIFRRHRCRRVARWNRLAHQATRFAAAATVAGGRPLPPAIVSAARSDPAPLARQQLALKAALSVARAARSSARSCLHGEPGGARSPRPDIAKRGTATCPGGTRTTVQFAPATTLCDRRARLRPALARTHQRGSQGFLPKPPRRR